MDEKLVLILDELIEEGYLWSQDIHYVKGSYGYKVSDSQKYEQWKLTCQRMIKSYFYDDLDDFSKYASDRNSKFNQEKMVGILCGIKKLHPLPQPTLATNDKKDGININLHNTNNLSQSQSLELVISIFNESIKDELKGKEIKELKAVLEEYKDKPEETKTKLTDKLKSFGLNTLSGIVSNIITNPNILNNL